MIKNLELNREALSLAKPTVKAWPDYIPGAEVIRILNGSRVSIHMLRQARRVLAARPDLAEKVMAGELSLYKAEEEAFYGQRKSCPLCRGKGFVHENPNHEK